MGQHHDTVRIEGVNESMKYTVVVEKAPSNYAAYVPDLPGCVATGATREAVLEEIREAIAKPDLSVGRICDANPSAY